MDCGNPNDSQKRIVTLDPLRASEDQFICYCKEVTKGRIIQAIQNGAKTLSEIKEITGANTGNECKTKNPKGTCCAGDIKMLLDYWVPKIESERRKKELTTNKSNVFRIGAIISALFASACCWLPLLLIIIGLSTAGISAILERYRTIFMITAFILLGLAFYFTYRKKPLSDADSCCENIRNVPGKFNKIMLWIIAVIVLAFVFFPNYVSLLSRKGDGQPPEIGNGLSRATFTIEGMTCEGCVLGIEKEIGKIQGVQKVEVSFPSKKATVYYLPKYIELSKIAEAIDKLGFKVTIAE